MPKITTKLAPPTKAAKQSAAPSVEPIHPELSEKEIETAGPAGLADESHDSKALSEEFANSVEPFDDGFLDEEVTYLETDFQADAVKSRQSGKSAKSTKSKPKAPAVNADPYEGFNVVISQAMALKLNPKTQNHIFFDVAVKQADKNLYLRMSGNEGGGLHSKEWLPVEPILSLIEKYQGQSFKSTVFNSLFRGSSANNAGFLGAVLRSPALGLLKASDVAVFQHQLPADYESKKAALTALNAV